jgi:hypothetical protein
MVIVEVSVVMSRISSYQSLDGNRIVVLTEMTSRVDDLVNIWKDNGGHRL